MPDIVVSFVELLVFLIKAVLISIPLAFIVLFLARLEKFFEKKFSLSWIKSCVLLNFIIVFCIVCVFYLWIFFGTVSFLANDSLPLGLNTVLIDEGSYFVEQSDFQNPLLDSISVFFLGVVKLALISFVVSLLLLPLEFLSSLVFSKFSSKKKKALNFKAFYAASLTALFVFVIVILLFPWIPAGIMYFVFFS